MSDLSFERSQRDLHDKKLSGESRGGGLGAWPPPPRNA